MTVSRDMETLGWGKDRSTLKQKSFLINGSGLARAAEIRRARKPVSIVSRVKAVPRSDWIAFLALIVSSIALFKDS